jgi:hypothetical protein
MSRRCPTTTSAQTGPRADLEAIVVLAHRRDGGGASAGAVSIRMSSDEGVS